MKTLPLEQSVDCACDPFLSRPVCMYALWSESRVAACLSCGKVECYRPEGDEPRGAGPVGGCNFLIPLPEEWYRWLGQWPRLLTWDIDRLVWAPAEFRAANVEEIEAAVSAAAWQLEMSAAQRLLHCGCPPVAPPHTPSHLTGDLRSYNKFWQLAQQPQRLEEFFEKYVTRR